MVRLIGLKGHVWTGTITMGGNRLDNQLLSIIRRTRIKAGHVDDSRDPPKTISLPPLLASDYGGLIWTWLSSGSMREPRITLLGAPGAGKGTQSSNIVDAYDVEHITTGDALRANKDMDTEYGTPREFMEAGELVPDPVVNEIVNAALEEADGFVLDGYPRNLSQAEYLSSMTDLDVVAYLEVSTEELLTRLTGRRVCNDCGTNYHVEYNPPEQDGVCDACGGELIQRDDDTAETARDRIEVFEENTMPVVEHFRDDEAFVAIDGEQAPDAVWADLKVAIDDRV